ncbi:hypothetical protein [Photobacterium rosenbergii]|uniref:Uncharacterized protein n=1 Tax=Photobacterium rosenbergii TaxID=294936 RepID=A0ABU3ZF07_9GAMM|nr:hypothetical protein [Photobacterium rosenbergii]MDV5168681.1 hypothetical protein [Photobacterium rosenbergii]
MYIIAYDKDGRYQDDIAAALPSGGEIIWLTSPKDLVSQEIWWQAQVLVIAAEHWPDETVEQLLDTFSPRHCILLDFTPECQWYGLPHRDNLSLCEPEDLAHRLSGLVSMETHPPKRLALMSATQGFDVCLLSLSLAWQVTARSKQPVLILDLGQPGSDIAGYLNKPAGVNFIRLLEHSTVINPSWLSANGAELVAGIHVVGMPESESFDAPDKDSLVTLMDQLEASYSTIIINLDGMPPCPLLYLFAARCDQHWLLTGQKNVSLVKTRRLAESLYNKGVRPGGVNLILAPYLLSVLPDKETIAEQLDLPVRGVLPCAHSLITDINAGTLLPPTGEYKQFLHAVDQLLRVRSKKMPWFNKITGMFNREVKYE